MDRRIERLKRVRSQITVVEPSQANARRLLDAYYTAYIDDVSLLRALNNGLPINGMTEPLTEAAFYELIEWPQTLALEISNQANRSGPPKAFVLAHFTGTDPNQRDAFVRFMTSKVFRSEALHYVSEASCEVAESALLRGNCLYLGECVSTESPLFTAALFAEAFDKVILNKMRGAKATVFGKCLEAASVDYSMNTIGNSRIKRIARALGMELLATERSLRLMTSASEPVEHSEPARNVALTFGMYLGEAEVAGRYLQSIGGSIR